MTAIIYISLSVWKFRALFPAQDLWKLAWSYKQLRVLCIRPIKFTRYCLTHLISKFSWALRSFEICWVRHYIVHKVLFGTWWRLQMETFSTLLALCEGNSPVTGEFPSQRPVTWSFDVFFDLRLNNRLSKPSRRRWFEMPLHPLWHHCN